MPNESAIALAVRKAGGPAALAKALSESVQTVSNWVARGQPPANKCVAIELVSGVPRESLREDWADYWPDRVPKAQQGSSQPEESSHA